MAGRGTCPFFFCSICGWRPQAFPCAHSGCRLCGLPLDSASGVFTLLLSYCLLLASCATSFSCESTVVTEAAGTALWTPLASLWGAGLLCFGHLANLKKAAEMWARICPCLSATHQNRCEQSVSVWCLGTSFLHPPVKAERTTPSLFSPGESENYSPQHYANRSGFVSPWLKRARDDTGGEGESKSLCFQHGVAMPWSGRRCPEPQSRFPSAVGADGDFWHIAWGGHLSLCS